MDVRTDEAGLGEFRALVRAAFEQAERSGKQGWDEMTTAVLKNRLLNLTRGQFSENRYGSPSFIHLVRRIPDLVTVISEQPPHHLRLVTSTSSHGGAASLSSTSAIEVDAAVTEPGIGDDELAGMRVRDDLWHAIIDYSTGKPYVYDPQSRIARPWVHGDLALPQFPTVSRDTVASWRDDFVASLDPATREKFGDSLRIWAGGRGRQADLPGSLRGGWGEFLKRKVAQNLLKWFQSRGIEPPEDMLTPTERRIGPAAEAIGEVVESQRLRDMIISAVRAMTYDELSQVKFPAAVWLRIHEDPKREK
jgi:hypothetical protein